ncbi:unnamed protein product, partial [Nesidiocoris tenuis]
MERLRPVDAGSETDGVHLYAELERLGKQWYNAVKSDLSEFPFFNSTKAIFRVAQQLTMQDSRSPRRPLSRPRLVESALSRWAFAVWKSKFTVPTPLYFHALNFKTRLCETGYARKQ